jgi:Mce-associated membrane protein
MSDTGRRPESLDAGHRKVTTKPDKAAAKQAKAEAKAAKAAKSSGPKVKKQRTSPKFVRSTVGFLKSLPGRVARLGERGYDAVTNRPVHAVRVLGIVVVAVALLAGLFWFQTDRWARADLARVEATDAGQAAVEQLLSYSYRSVDRQVAKAEDVLTGSFKEEYAKFLNDDIAAKAKDKQAVVRTAVDRSAVVDASPGEVTLLVYFEQLTEAKDTPDGVSSGLSSVRVTLEKEDGKWKVSEITPV